MRARRPAAEPAGQKRQRALFVAWQGLIGAEDAACPQPQTDSRQERRFQSGFVHRRLVDQNVAGVALGNDASLLEQRDVIGEGPGEIDVMGR